jgi:transcriptional repressor of cell division inhibition gene dicB
MSGYKINIGGMTKSEAVAIFGASLADLGRALGLTRGRISQWPEVLTDKQTDRVIGAALRLHKPLPARFRIRRAKTPRDVRQVA